jgi:hypothetical protein
MIEHPKRTAYERWKQYHFANTHVYELFEQFAREAMQRKSRIGARFVFERIRWYEQVEKGCNHYRVNNDFVAFYARLLMLEKSEFKGLFITRKIKSGVTNDDIRRDVIERPSGTGSCDPNHSAGASGPKAA